MFENNVFDYIKNGLNDCIKNHEIPVSAIILDSSNQVVSCGINNRQSDHCVLGHAEINAIIDAERKVGDWRLDGYKMIVSLAPCSMCRCIIDECRLVKVYYLCHSDEELKDKDKYEFLDCNYLPEKYIKNLLTNFFNNRR